MANLKVRFFLTLVTIAAFSVPFFAVVAVESLKRDKQLLADQELAASIKKDAEAARYEYYLGVAQQRDVLKQSMTDAKAQYEKLLKDQPQMIQDNQKTVTQTTIEPVVTQRVVNVPVTTTVSTPTATSKPKTSTKTKAS